MPHNHDQRLTALPSQPLTGSDLHIWYASLNVSPQDLLNYRSSLSADEVERALRFVFEKNRNHFIVGRGVLRTILGSYLELEPAQVEFVYGPHGKPALKLNPKDQVLEFNLSHSKDLVLYAFNWNRKVGIDVEYIQPVRDMDRFAEQFFSPHETAFFNSVTCEQKETAFLKIWTCKEAFLKANGSGLTVALNEVEVSFESGKAVTLRAIGSDQEQAKHWRLEIFTPISGYQAALAVEGNESQIVFFDIDEQGK